MNPYVLKFFTHSCVGKNGLFFFPLYFSAQQEEGGMTKAPRSSSGLQEAVDRGQRG